MDDLAGGYYTVSLIKSRLSRDPCWAMIRIDYHSADVNARWAHHHSMISKRYGCTYERGSSCEPRMEYRRNDLR